MFSVYDGIAETFWQQTSDGGAGANTLTVSAITGKSLYCTAIQYSGDAAATVTIESPASTILWSKTFAAAFTGSETFSEVPIEGASGAALIVKVSAATADSKVNAQGFSGSG